MLCENIFDFQKNAKKEHFFFFFGKAHTTRQDESFPREMLHDK